ncbi:hypothetical protein HK097_001828 [Rhizophlyctis rosea]|uniref:Uncharacterized protein n=1 Tax=Rhizophlyctis rosea TaxID=64517 RepID=A0AAD5X1M0_9FUNG|nr:hypothetical protein HK097_001828 [Rhizophlyctis rosea]
MFPQHSEDIRILTDAASPVKAAVTNANAIKNAALSVGRIYRERYYMLRNMYFLETCATCFFIGNETILTSHDILPSHLPYNYLQQADEYRFFVLWQDEWDRQNTGKCMSLRLVDDNCTHNLRHYVSLIDGARPFASIFRVNKPFKNEAIVLQAPTITKSLAEVTDSSSYRVATLGYQSEWGMPQAVAHYDALPEKTRQALPRPTEQSFLRSSEDDLFYLKMTSFVTAGCCGSPVLFIDLEPEKVFAGGLVIGGYRGDNNNTAVSLNDATIQAMFERNRIKS